jgi:CHAT domain-containing protein
LDTNVGNVYHRLDRNADALECYQRALAAFRAQNDSFAIALTSYNSANIHCNLHEFEKARSCYQLAEDLYREKGMDLAAAQARYSLGYLDFMTGRYHQAMRALHQAEVEFERLGDTRMGALCLLDLAEICLQLNVLQEAADLAARARDRFQELELRYEEAKSLLFLGLAHAGLSRLDDAETLLVRAEDSFRAEGNSLYVGLSVVYRAELQLHRGSPERALEIIDDARSAFERPDLGAKRMQAKLIEARALHAMGNRDAALSQCFAIAEALAGIDALWLETEMHELFGDLCLDGDDRSAAYEHYLAAVALIEQRRVTIRVDDFRTAFMRYKLRVYEKLIHLCLDENKAAHNALAFYYVESRKARTLVDIMTNDLDLWPASAEMDEELKAEWTRLREELHWLHRKLRDDRNSNNDKPPLQGTDSRLVVTAGNLASRIKAKEDELARLMLKAQAADPDFAALENSAGLTVDDLRHVLGPNDLLIEYYADGANLAAFLIDHNATDVVRLPCVLDEVRERMLELKFLLEKFQYGAGYVRRHEVSLREWANESMRWFYDALIGPFSERLTGKGLVIVPFDALHGLPFHALYDGQDYLIDRCEIACAPSARLYAMCRRRNEQARSRISVFGVPDELAPQIQNEVQTIARCFPHARSFVGDRATSEELARAAGSSDILHIATHAMFRQDNPMFSGFKLFDQWVNAYDVASLRMNSTLITLSGCSTGAGRVYAGDETIGLVRSFLKAGAASLVVSLWPVNDPSAAALMGKFYEELGRGTPSRAALRRAIVDSKLVHANPYYWAPFVLIGRD